MRKIFIVLLVVAMDISFSSCMMMMADHLSGSMQEDHNHVSPDVKIDQVCGKQVGEENSFSYEYQGNIYYFDTEQCLSVFKSNPDHFLQKHNKDFHKKVWIRVGWIGGAVVMTAMMVFMLTYIF